jgi:hypothetical protein
VVDWLVLAAVLEAVFGKHRVRQMLGVALLVFPARLLIAGRSISLSELIGGIIAWALWEYSLCRLERPARLLAWLAIAALVLRGLAPFHPSGARYTFSWIPFGASLSAEYGSSLVIVFKKSFLYGAPIWLFHKAGHRYFTATAGVSALLAAIEFLQLYLPGRTAESTDPLLAIIMGIVLKLLDASSSLANPARTNAEVLLRLAGTE